MLRFRAFIAIAHHNSVHACRAERRRRRSEIRKGKRRGERGRGRKIFDDAHDSGANKYKKSVMHAKQAVNMSCRGQTRVVIQGGIWIQELISVATTESTYPEQ